jgi:hypothetical protein
VLKIPLCIENESASCTTVMSSAYYLSIRHWGLQAVHFVL